MIIAIKWPSDDYVTELFSMGSNTALELSFLNYRRL